MSFRTRSRSLADATRDRLQRSPAGAFARRLAAVGFFESVTLFGAALLISVLPYLILLSSLANHRIDTDISRHIGLNRQGAGIVSQLFRSSPSHSVAGIVTGLIFAAAGTVTVASSLQVIYERTFGQPHRGWQDLFRFVTWAAVLFGVLAADSVISGPIRIVSTPVGVAGFFWWTMRFLLAGRVSWRVLLRPAIATGLLWIGLELFAAVYFSEQIVSDSTLYGPIGVVFSLMVWFIAIGAVIVLGAAAGAVWAEHAHAKHAAHAKRAEREGGGKGAPLGEDDRVVAVAGAVGRVRLPGLRVRGSGYREDFSNV